MPTLLGSGTVTDGGGVAAVQIFVVRPDGSSTIVTATPDGPARTAFFVFNQPGVYQALVVATDLAGNKATQLLAAITATGATIPPQIPAVSAMGSGAVTPATSTFFSGTVVAITATADAGWPVAATNAGKSETSASGVYTVGNLADNWTASPGAPRASPWWCATPLITPSLSC